MYRQVALFALFLVSACSSHQQSEPSIEPSARAQFESLSGEIGVTIHGSDRTVQIALRHGRVENAHQLMRAPREATGMIGPGGAKMLPDRSDGYYQGPYIASPNRRLIAASVVESRSEFALPQAVVIFDRHLRRDVGRATVGNDEAIHSLAWSPDSTRLAILKSTSSARFSLENALSALGGHFVGYQTYYVSIFDADGNAVMQTRLVQGIKWSWGEIVWQ